MSTVVCLLTLDDGAVHRLCGPTVVGRSPVAGDADMIALLPGSELASKNHVRLEPVNQRVALVTDLATTNGTRVDVGSGWIEVVPHQPTHVTLPCRIECGGPIVRLESDPATGDD